MTRANPRGCGRPLAALNLVALEDIAREFGISDQEARELVADLPPVRRRTRGRRWVWQEVLDHGREEPRQEKKPAGKVLALREPSTRT